MNTAINNTVSQYLSSFVEKVATQFNIPQEQLDNLWKETQKEKMVKIKRKATNATTRVSAYINFCNHHRKIVKSENPALTFGEVAKSLGKLWKELNVEEKKKYIDPAYVGTHVVNKPEEEKKKRVRKAKE